MTTTLHRPLALTLSMALAAGLACAQESERSPLSGPEVKSDRPDSIEDRFSAMENGSARMGQVEAIPVQDLRRIVFSMMRAEDESLRLSQEQSASIREFTRDHEMKRRAWMLEHREELARLYEAAGLEMPSQREGQRAPRGEGRERARPGTGERRPASAEPGERDMRERLTPDSTTREGRRPMPAQERGPNRAVSSNESDLPPATPEQQAARQQLRAFMSKSPGAGDLERQIFSVLNEKQREHFNAEVNTLLEERSMEAMRRRVESEKRDREAGGPGAGAAADRGQALQQLSSIDWDKVLPADGSVNLESLPPNLQERLGSVEPERQRAVLERLRARLQRDGGGD